MKQVLKSIRELAALGAILAFVAGLVVLHTLGTPASGATTSTYSPVTVAMSSATPTPPVSVGPSLVAASPTAAGSSSLCGSAGVSSDSLPPTIATRTRGATFVFAGTVKQIAAARWNTSDGSAPAFGDLGHPPIGSEIVTPVTVAIDTTFKGMGPSSLVVWLAGGTVGCYTFYVAGSPIMTVGSRYAVFLSPTAATGLATVPLQVRAAWTINPDGSIDTPADGRMSAEAFAAAVTAVK